MPVPIDYVLPVVLEEDSNDECRLFEADPFESEMMPFITFAKPQCVPQNPSITRLENNRIIINENNYLNVTYSNCFTKCHYPTTEKFFHSSDWQTLSPEKEITCDVVEIQCYYETPKGSGFNVQKAAYWNIHVQTYRRNDTVLTNDTQRPSVHIFVVDSVSHPEMIRSLPKTLTYLREKFDIVPFPFHSLNGKVSYHNGFAAFFGKNVVPETVNEGIYPSRPTDYKDFDQYLDDDQYIGKIFQSADYVTALCESTQSSFFSRFKGFQQLPADHICNPAAGVIDEQKIEVFYNRCDNYHHYQFEYLESFAKEYDRLPKFSLSWNTQLTHESINTLYPEDDKFLEFFKSIEKELENSYFILMGDHGPRYGDFRNISAGHRENLNPALFISLPKALRENHPEVVDIVKNNSRRLTTHYDLFATLVDIADSKDPKFSKENLVLYGKSFLKPIEEQRSCKSLMILPDLCICEIQKTLIPDKSIASNMANFVISNINKKTILMRNICHSLTLSPYSSPILEQVHFPGITDVNLYKLQFETYPGTGRFWTFIIENKEGEYSIMANTIHRGSARKLDTLCDPPFAPNFCACKYSK